MHMDRPGTIRKTKTVAAHAAAVLGVVALALMGQRLSPPQMAPAGGGIDKKACDVDAPQPLHAAAKKWCADGLFQKIAVTGDSKTTIAVARFNANGAQTWQLQSGLLIGEFRNLSDQMAAAAPEKNLAIDLHDAADRRVGSCARTPADTTSTCGTK
jgi:hypothetical protein